MRSRSLLSPDLSAPLLACALLLGSPQVATAQEADDDGRAKYIEATTALGCNEGRHGGSAHDAERERANLATLRKHGFSARSYFEAAARWSEDPRVQGAIETAMARCEGVDDFAEGSYKATHKGGRLAGVEATLDVRVRGGQVSATFQGTAAGQPFRITTPRVRALGAHARFEGKQERYGAGYGYRLELRQGRAGSIEAVAVISMERGGTFVVPLTARSL